MGADIIIDPWNRLTPTTHYEAGLAEYVSKPEKGVSGLVSDFLRRNNIQTREGMIDYVDKERIAVVDISKGSRLVFYVSNGNEEKNPVIGQPIAGQMRTHREDKWCAEGTIEGSRVKLEARVVIEKSDDIPRDIHVSAKRVDDNPYWFVKEAKQK